MEENESIKHPPCILVHLIRSFHISFVFKHAAIDFSRAFLNMCMPYWSSPPVHEYHLVTVVASYQICFSTKSFLVSPLVLFQAGKKLLAEAWRQKLASARGGMCIVLHFLRTAMDSSSLISLIFTTYSIHSCLIYISTYLTSFLLYLSWQSSPSVPAMIRMRVSIS